MSDLRATAATSDGVRAVFVTGLTLTNVQSDTNGDDGFELVDVAGLTTLTDLVASSNGDEGFFGSNVNAAGTVTFSGGTFSGNGTATTTGAGILFTGVGAVVTTNVTATGNDPGILIMGALSYTDTDGNYSGNSLHGIQLVDIAGNVTLVRTTADDNDASTSTIRCSCSSRSAS